MKKICPLLLVLFLITATNKSNAQGTWSNLGKGMNGWVYALCADTVNNVLYAGGNFDTAGTVKQNYLAKWDGTKWDTTVSLSSGNYVYALIMYKGNLIIGFSDGSVGEYNGSTFQYLPGFNESIYCFYIHNDTLYAGGKFTQSGSTTLNCIAKWNGTKWLSVDNGVSWVNCCPEVDALTEYDGNLIATGTFDQAGNVAVTSIAAYDGSKWNSIGINLSEYINTPYNSSLEVYNNKLYLIGLFDSVNSAYSNSGVASWDGTNWDTVLSNTGNYGGLAPANFKMKTFDNYLFVSGVYNGQSPYKYDGHVLSTVDSGVRAGNIYAMTTWNGSLYVGGDFQGTTEVRPYTSFDIARWTPDSATGIKQPVKDNELVSVYPNPASNQLRFSSSGLTKQIQVEDVLGQLLLEKSFNGTLQKQIIDVSALPQGIYFYRVTDSNSQVVTGKFVLVK